MIEQIKYEAIFYDLPDGTEPAAEFINSVSNKMASKILWTINLLEEYGPSLREPYSKMIDDGILELRIKVGLDITRVMYFFMVGKKVILTHGFVKKTEETPPSEIDRAKKYREEYLSRPEFNS